MLSPHSVEKGSDVSQRLHGEGDKSLRGSCSVVGPGCQVEYVRLREPQPGFYVEIQKVVGTSSNGKGTWRMAGEGGACRVSCVQEPPSLSHTLIVFVVGRPGCTSIHPSDRWRLLHPVPVRFYENDCAVTAVLVTNAFSQGNINCPYPCYPDDEYFTQYNITIARLEDLRAMDGHERLSSIYGAPVRCLIVHIDINLQI